MKLPMQGGCRCERVRFRVTQAPLVTMACHCHGCQRMSSSAFSLTATFLADAFEITQGAPVIGGLHGPDANHLFCAHCMTWMFTRPVIAAHIVNVRPTMLDDDAWFSPFVETFTKTKLPWASTGAVHSYEEFPPMEAYDGLMREFAARPPVTGATVRLNHTIVHSRDARAASAFVASLLGLPEPEPFGPFFGVKVANALTLDFLDAGEMEIQTQHYAFLVGDGAFDEIFARIQERGLAYWADPGRQQAGQVNRHFGGRGVYFQDPSGHLLEIITRPYGKWDDIGAT